MSRDEWLFHSDEWRKGWCAYSPDDTALSIEELKCRPKDWQDGYLYAMHNPTGKYYNASEEWRKGWHAYNCDDKALSIEELQCHSKDWQDGYLYAAQHFTGGYSATATTGPS